MEKRFLILFVYASVFLAPNAQAVALCPFPSLSPGFGSFLKVFSKPSSAWKIPDSEAAVRQQAVDAAMTSPTDEHTWHISPEKRAKETRAELDKQLLKENRFFADLAPQERMELIASVTRQVAKRDDKAYNEAEARARINAVTGVIAERVRKKERSWKLAAPRHSSFYSTCSMRR